MVWWTGFGSLQLIGCLQIKWCTGQGSYNTYTLVSRNIYIYIYIYILNCKDNSKRKKKKCNKEKKERKNTKTVGDPQVNMKYLIYFLNYEL